MPWRTFKAWDDRVHARRIKKRNQASRDEWRRQIEAMKARGG